MHEVSVNMGLRKEFIILKYFLLCICLINYKSSQTLFVFSMILQSTGSSITIILIINS